MENKREIAPVHCVQFVQRETVERYVTALYEPGAYSPNYGGVAVCLACGFGFDLGDGMAYLPASARFCPICGSRFERKAHIAGLYPEEDGKAERDGIQGMALRERYVCTEEHRALIGDALYEQLMEQYDRRNRQVNVWEF